MKRLIRKIAAAGAGGLMLMSALGGAFAAGETLADLPAPFVVSDAYVATAMVVGSAAGLNDDNARSTLKTYFDSLATAEAAGLGDQIQTEEIKFQDNIATSTGLDTVYDDSDSDLFFDDEVSIGGTSYDYHTELQVNSTADRFDIETSLTSDDDKYETDPKLEMRKKALKYCYVFDEQIQLNNTATTSNPFDMQFLGKTIRVDAVNNETKFTAQVGDTWVGHAGETYTGNGITMEVVTVDATSAIVDFGNDQRTLSEGSTISEGDIDVYLDSAVAGVGDLSEAVAKFVIGEDARVSYSDGDKFSTYCSPSDGHGDPDCDKDNPDWIWDLKGLVNATSGDANSICIENDFEAFTSNKDPAGVGEYYGLPDGFIYVGIDDLTVADTDYMDVTITGGTSNTVDISNAGGIYANFNAAIVVTLESDETEGFVIKDTSLNATSKITSDIKTDKIYLWSHAGHNGELAVLYEDTNNKIQHAGNATLNNATIAGAPSNFSVTIGNLNNKNTKGDDVLLKVWGSNISDDSFWLGFIADTTVSANDAFWLRINTDIDHANATQGMFQGFGVTDNDEASEVVWTNSRGTHTNNGPSLIANTTNLLIGGKSKDQRTGYGIVIKNTDTGGDNDEFVLDVPGDNVKANVAVYEGGAAASVEPVLTTESGATGYDNLILVGGPCVNSLTADYLGVTYPACGSASGFAPDTAVIKMVEKDGKSALIVAGWEKVDTERAASSVAAGGLTGTEQIV